MQNLIELPKWLGTALIGAALAAAGYVVKLILEWLREINDRRRSRRARLTELYSLLQAGRVAFLIQSSHRNTLTSLITKRKPNLAKLTSEQGYEQLFTAAHKGMTKKEKELHGIIRTITENTLCPINKLLLKWVREDDYFRARMWGRGKRTELALALSQLEVHLDPIRKIRRGASDVRLFRQKAIASEMSPYEGYHYKTEKCGLLSSS